MYGNATENIAHLNRTSTSHGTQVAHVIAASGHGSADGVAPGVSLLDAMYGPGESHRTFRAAFVQMMDWAHANGADVINISAGTGKCYNNLASIYAIVTETVNKGTVVVSAGGNDPGFGQIGYPACVPSGIAVGGLNSRGTSVWFGASRGPSSYNEPQLLPHIAAPANLISVPNFSTESPTFTSLDGTSFAASMVSAAAALLLQQDGSLNPMEVKSAILLGARWTGGHGLNAPPETESVPCTSAHYEIAETLDGCSYAFDGSFVADTQLFVLNGVGFGILNVSQSLRYAANHSSHFASGTLDAGTQARSYGINVTGAAGVAKVLLTWQDPAQRSASGDGFARKDLDFVVSCPGMDGHVNASSSHQPTEFAVFSPPEDGVCAVIVSSHAEHLRDGATRYVLASTHELVPPPSGGWAYPTGVAPTVPDYEYRQGDTVSMNVTFPFPVDVRTGGGSPYILLDLDNGTGHANYTGGGGTRELAFEYEVMAGDFAESLEYASREALVVPDGSGIEYAHTGTGIVPVLPAPGEPGSLGASGNISINGTQDAVAPTAVSARATGTGPASRWPSPSTCGSRGMPPPGGRFRGPTPQAPASPEAASTPPTGP